MVLWNIQDGASQVNGKEKDLVVPRIISFHNKVNLCFQS